MLALPCITLVGEDESVVVNAHGLESANNGCGAADGAYNGVVVAALGDGVVALVAFWYSNVTVTASASSKSGES